MQESRIQVRRPLLRLAPLWVALLCLLSAPLAASDFARPKGLEPDVDFWRKVFAEVSTNEALVHDNRKLGIVYETVTMPKKASPQRQRRISEKVRNKYRAILKNLATGKRTGLTSEESRVLNLWPEGVTNAELRAASRQVRFQQGLSDRYKAGLVRSGRWRGHIVKALKREGVPEGLAALPHVESSFNPKAHSHVGASGLWQFTRATGRRFMRIDHVVDERRDPFTSSDAAARLLADNYSIVKSWPMAITAYNHGVSGMRRAAKKVGTKDIETILRKYDGRSFGFASRNFYVAFLAALEVQTNHEKYFGAVTKDQPQRETRVELPDYFAADALASALGVSRATLQGANPALLNSVWDGSKYAPRGYTLRLPPTVKSAPQLLAGIPASQRFLEQTPDLYHKVRRGESLSAIARKYRTNVSQLVALNGLRSRNRIRVGQVLRLPYSGAPPASPISVNTETYTVRRGDTLGRIATRAGMTQSELLTLNSIRNRNRIYPGQKLLLKAPPQAAAAAPAEAPPSAPPEVVAVAPTPAPTAVPEPVAPEPALPPVVAAEAAQALADTAASGTVEATQELVLLDNAGESNDPVEAQSDAIAVDTESDSASLADPNDYLVADDSTIEVQAEETLGHFGDWLEIKTQRIRDLNGLAFRKPVVIGTRLKLKFGSISREEFTSRRIAYHRELQEAFFTQYRITDTTEHKLRRGESVWELAFRRYKVPVWLLRQYNPDLDMDRVRPGAKIVFPQIEVADNRDRKAPTLADAT